MINLFKSTAVPKSILMTLFTLCILLLSACGGGESENALSNNQVSSVSNTDVTVNEGIEKTQKIVFSENAEFGTFATPFNEASLWNARPLKPVLGSYVLPATPYFPFVGPGDYSTGVFQSSNNDMAVTVTGVDGTYKTLWDADSQVHRDVVVPHWPASTRPAAGTDGHAEIIDETAGVIHSFWQLKKVDGQWRAAQYAWMPLNGSGWGTPSHPLQGARSAGVPSSAGLIRIGEINDGHAYYRHALAMTLAHNALSANPAYVFPATSADWDAATANYGAIPLGTLMMLPQDFDSTKISSPQLRKVVETLKTFGARVVDRNTDTRFTIFAENGSSFNLMPNGWDNKVADDLKIVADALRPVVSISGWLDGKGTFFIPKKNLNLLSLRGPWISQSGKTNEIFNTLAQALEIAEGVSDIYTHYWANSLSSVTWAPITPGKNYRLKVKATNGGSLRLIFRSSFSGTVLLETRMLFDGEVADFVAPSDIGSPVISATAKNGLSSKLSVELFELCGVAFECSSVSK